MQNCKFLATIGVAFLAAGLFSTARADEWNKQTTVTFTEPVEIPGQVLPAGTYMFKLADSDSNRDIVQIFNQDQNHLYATLLAIPDYRIEPTGKTVIRFEERKAQAPEALKAWFYPGDMYGFEFVYPNSRAMELAKNTNQNVLSMPSSMAANTIKPVKSMHEAPVTAMKQAPVTAVKPSGEQVAMAQAVQTHPETNAQPAQSSSRSRAAKMPSTASPFPLMALIGILTIGAGAAFGLLARRTA